MKRMLAVVISFVIVGGSGPTTGQDVQAEQKAKIEQQITSLGTRYWDKAAASLGKLGSGKSVGPLLRAARDESSAVRQSARDALVRIGCPAAPAVARVLRDPNPQVRWTAALMLGKMASEQGATALVEALSDGDWMVRNEAAVALARTGSDKCVPPLKALLQGQNAELSLAAAWVLAEIQAPRSAPYLQAIEDLRGEGIKITQALYPQTLETQPAIPSPCWTADHSEVVVARTAANRWAVIPVTLENSEKRGRQLMVDAVDFPALAASGLHSEKELDAIQAITGRSLAEITSLGRPGALSTEGFLAADEDVISVLKGDNRLVSAMKLTHRELARPLFHIWNMIGTDLDLGRWNMAEHRWKNIQSVLYHGKTVLLNAGDTKGGQRSIFADGFDDGSFWIEISRELVAGEKAFIASKYGHLTSEQRDVMVKRLSSMSIGEMEPHYIMWYGFYEGHTQWRADPLAIAFIFGLRSLEALEKAFPGRLYQVMTKHFSREHRE